MNQRFVLILLFSFCLHVYSQNAQDSIFQGNSISEKLYTKCFENLNQGAIFFEKYPKFKRTDVCDLSHCMLLLSFPEKEVQTAGEDLLRGIATQLYREGNPVYMIDGMESYERAAKENKNLEDDDHLVYINYAECVSPFFLSRAAKIINEETLKLIKQHKKSF
ncbi:hypothetical protein [Flavobacterium reichenbachii]|uniref:Uncharacterized protein n=1 Tax=Flavobacterium reichenbachii TaxID=362418 RepID=A0A085ZJS9_9FLAO|nr:hypothetical protein [Flavobacterium reichenbachii]KFF04693.1 hypothetical protein IW19_03715 [Flavobacterium reichenbachii]OXB09888.1 hypothetical protein B0A68_23390 [Flavobacterium reichenbachii]